MFFSGAVMATLYFGGYDIPFVNDATLIQYYWAKLGSIIAGAVFFVKNILVYFLIYVGKLDDSAIPL